MRESLEHLRPWMPWAQDDQAADPAVQETRLVELDAAWHDGREHGYVMVEAAAEQEGRVVGSCSLMRRVGPGGIEIGYFVHVDFVRRGYATAAARALTGAALALDDVDRVEIHCDEANVASAAVPRRLGYRLVRVDEHQPDAPGECGRRLIWATSG